METTVVHWGNIGIMEKKMETTIVDYSILVYSGVCISPISCSGVPSEPPR